jgi:hypothetical protein
VLRAYQYEYNSPQHIQTQSQRTGMQGSIKKESINEIDECEKKGSVMERSLRLIQFVMLPPMPFLGQLLLQKMLRVQFHSLFLR